MNAEQPVSDAELAGFLKGKFSYDSPTDLSRLLDRLGFSMKKRFGQNFMVSPSARGEIISLAGPIAGRSIWEIGPGIGALTHQIFGKAGHVRVFEIDHGFIRVLKVLFGARSDFSLVEGDVLKTWEAAWQEEAAEGGPAAIIGNLPYNVGSAIIVDMLGAGCIAPRMVFTVQKEVAERMAARPGDSGYSSFSVHCQARCRVSIESTLKPACFWPQPEVTSAVVLLQPREQKLPVDNQEVFNILVRSMFAARRKTLENNLKSSPLNARFGMDILKKAAESAGVDIKARGETLSPEIFAQWSNYISAHQ